MLSYKYNCKASEKTLISHEDLDRLKLDADVQQKLNTR